MHAGNLGRCCIQRAQGGKEDASCRVSSGALGCQEIKHADSLSRTIDTYDFALSHQEFYKLCKRWGFPTGDVFAGAAKGFHKASRYFTMAYTPNTLGVNALLQDWNQLGNSQGRVLLWVFLPFQLNGDTIRKLA